MPSLAGSTVRLMNSALAQRQHELPARRALWQASRNRMSPPPGAWVSARSRGRRRGIEGRGDLPRGDWRLVRRKARCRAVGRIDHVTTEEETPCAAGRAACCGQSRAQDLHRSGGAPQAGRQGRAAGTGSAGRVECEPVAVGRRDGGAILCEPSRWAHQQVRSPVTGARPVILSVTLESAVAQAQRTPQAAFPVPASSVSPPRCRRSSWRVSALMPE